ncbi:hypothetical protein FHX64_002374 [Microbacter margulisiae]|uniref:Uncharacterized protein n=1 Tax=Microbacter margulisiae TaxID=1350067 RepID=A0A7W5DSM7_9PORP|nr:hypothetical protein [Microbacter margulisiae]
MNFEGAKILFFIERANGLYNKILMGFVRWHFNTGYVCF